MIPKPSFKRRKPRLGARGRFNEATRDKIHERFNGLCGECGRVGEHIHHIKYKSQMGRGVESNGVLLCHKCHADIHRYRTLALKWEEWAIENFGPLYYQDEWD